ncbi:hypothetical protein [Rhizobium sp. PAMB 3182]
MTILGCDDTATKCNFIATANQQWTTVAACDQDTANVLDGYSDAEFPMVIAVCQADEPGSMQAAAAAAKASSEATPAATPEKPAAPEVKPKQQAKTTLPAKVPVPTPAPATQSEQPTGNGLQASAEPPAAPAPVVVPMPPEEEDPGFAARAMTRIKKILPTGKDFKKIVEAPVHVVTDSYSWVARKVTKNDNP